MADTQKHLKPRGRRVRMSKQRVTLSFEVDFDLLPKKGGHVEFRVLAVEAPTIVPRDARRGRE